tara:strand:- start:14402 stop:15424 length:1023 start_codon:yes stop_codon:yes gene_type:complete
MTDIIVRTSAHAGHITLNRPRALNALTWDMCLAIEAAIDAWRDDDTIRLVIIDGAGDRAFCSGGDIADMYASGQSRDYGYGRKFWRDEYRLNAKLAKFPKPIVTFLHGFTMGGGVGVGCHASHRIVCETSQIALPECTIGLVPDVGGSLLLANAPGYIGTYLGLTGDRMDAGDAIFTGFADYFIPQDQWDALKSSLENTGDVEKIAPRSPPAARLQDWQPALDRAFAHNSLGAIYTHLHNDTPSAYARKHMDRNSPLAMACAIALINAARVNSTIEAALEQEYRFTHRAVQHSDFIEGIRAAIIDRDRHPKWQHAKFDAVTQADITKMTAPLGADALTLT